jgi:hypothetical protein
VKRLLATVATATLALGGLVATATSASAHTPNVHATCESLSLDLTQYREKWGDKTNTVTVKVNGKKVLDESFGRSFSETLPLDAGKKNRWVVKVDAGDDDKWDEKVEGTTKPCVKPERTVETAFYVYEKLDENKPAAWDNSGFQTLITTRDGDEFWETLPEEYPGEHFDVEDLPEDVCTAWGVQQDVVKTHGDFTWSDYVHITFPEGPLFGWRLQADRHDELSKYLPECAEKQEPEQVNLPAPSPVEHCEADSTVTLPETDLAAYSEDWNDDRTEVTVTATAPEGVEFPEGTETTWTFAFTGEICASVPEAVTPELPSVVDLCGTENDDIRLPADTEGVSYETTSAGLVATPAEGFAFSELPDEYAAQEDGTAVYTVAESTFTDEACEIIPGDIGAVCDSSTPYLLYGISLPEGVEAEGDNPLTITFLNPDGGEDHVTTDLPLEGRLLWPGASATAPLQWPGWEQLEDGSYVETEGNFAWTRDGVQVLFEVNPDYSTVVDYPPASEECADAPADIQQVADTVDAPEVAAEDDELAVTGATVGIAAAVALLLVAGGVTLFIVRRRLQQS